jgi:hypothetical protein
MEGYRSKRMPLLKRMVAGGLPKKGHVRIFEPLRFASKNIRVSAFKIETPDVKSENSLYFHSLSQSERKNKQSVKMAFTINQMVS